MRYSQMSPRQRREVLDDAENYPLRVSFLGKTGLLSREEIAFLLRNRVDFDVDDRQFAWIQAEHLSPAPSSQAEACEGEPEVAGHTRGRLAWSLPAIALAVLSAFVLLKRGGHFLSGGPHDK